MTRLGDTLAALKAARAARGGVPTPDGRLSDMIGFGTNPGRLRMKVFAPAGRPAAGLVVVLHGCTQTAEGFAGPSGWLDLAARHGFVLVAPEQTRENNPNLCFNWYQPDDMDRHGGEAESIAQMTAHAVSVFGVDPGKVFVTGFSAGGAMTSVMLAAWPEQYAAGAVVAGLPYGVASSVSEAFQAMSGRQPRDPGQLAGFVRDATRFLGRRPRVSVWHGGADTIVNPGAGEAVAAQWREVFGASGPSRTARTPAGRDFLVWMTADGDPVLELHKIPGLGHAVPVSTTGPERCGTAGSYSADIGFSAAYEIALGWGLVTVKSATETMDDLDCDALGAPPYRVQGSIAQVIDDALRSAGLVR